MSFNRIIALSGGVGGAKLVLGLAHVLPPERLLVISNTGDDFDHYGLRICPDTDTLLYTLSGLADPARGWGRANETWNFMSALRELGGDDWFNLGDGDLALHVMRTNRLSNGATISEVTNEIATSLGIKVQIMPMSDQPVATIVKTRRRELAFQEYFVRERCSPTVTGFKFENIAAANPNPALVESLHETPAGVVIAPSNPFVSIDPILAVPGMQKLLRNSGAPIIAVSPIICGKAVKGPAAKMFKELGKKASALEIARHYQGFIDGLIIDESDANQASDISSLGIQVVIAATLMLDLSNRIDLAKVVIDFANQLSGEIKR